MLSSIDPIYYTDYARISTGSHRPALYTGLGFTMSHEGKGLPVIPGRLKSRGFASVPYTYLGVGVCGTRLSRQT